MIATLIAYTKYNRALRDTPHDDVRRLLDAPGTFADRLCEFAGRVCYRSTDRMGQAPGFIAARIREGHEDIIEHASAVIEFSDVWDNAHLFKHLRNITPHCEVRQAGVFQFIVAANLRTWRILSEHIPEALPILGGIAPATFADKIIDATPIHSSPNFGCDYIDKSGRVTMLAFTYPMIGRLSSATFLIEHISRACTHQLVRHRLGSFSQESQRYVDLSKGEWQAIAPPAIADSWEASAVLSEFWREAEVAYAKLRELGIRKEDARYLLPNAAETRMVVTMPFHAWRHFLWQRALDKAAQWEIREIGQSILHHLYAIAPDEFTAEMKYYTENIQ